MSKKKGGTVSKATTTPSNLLRENTGEVPPAPEGPQAFTSGFSDGFR